MGWIFEFFCEFVQKLPEKCGRQAAGLYLGIENQPGMEYDILNKCADCLEQDQHPPHKEKHT